MFSTILRQWALVLAGAVASVLGTIALAQLGFSWLLTGLLIAFVCILLLVGVGAGSWIGRKFYLSIRKRRPRIGILNDIEWSRIGSQTEAWTTTNSEQWLADIKGQVLKRGLNVRVYLITKDHNFDQYTAIVNPYGGVYPEKDTVDLHTLRKIFKYVKDTGLFVNVADIPGYWAYNVLLQRCVEAAPPLRGMILQEGKLLIPELPLFSMVPWIQQLGLRVYNMGNGVTSISLQVEATFDDFTESRLRPLDLSRAAKVENNMQVILGHPWTNSEGEIPLVIRTRNLTNSLRCSLHLTETESS